MRKGYIHAPHHAELCNALDGLASRDIKRLIVEMPPRVGKALAVDTPIPTPYGWCEIGKLRVGDLVFDENGNKCCVTWVSPVWKNRNVYSVTSDDGEVIIADEAHEWPVILCRKRMVTSIRATSALAKQRSKKPMSETCSPLNMPDAYLPVEPYILGYWLGDGTSANGSITVGAQDKEHLLRQIELAGYASSPSKKEPRRVWVLGLRKGLVECGVLGNKHVPQFYMRGSIEQRKALLQGLIDSDGYVSDNRGHVEFCSTNKRLADGVFELVCSLGLKCFLKTGRATIDGRDCGEKYRVGFYFSEACRLPRKLEKCRDTLSAKRRYLSVEPAGQQDTICIEVDSPSHLFLAGRHMVPTHNSYHVSEAFPAHLLGLFPHQNVIATSHGDAQARRFGRRVRNLILTPEYQEVFPGTRLDRRTDAQDEFMTQAGGLYLAVGIHGSFMGTGGDCVIVDDPFKSRKDADSPTIRANVQTAYDDLENRLEPNAVVVCMHTRWHDDDLVGFLERTRIKTGKEKWHRITFPMIQDECPRWEKVEAESRENRGRIEESSSGTVFRGDIDAYNRERALWPERYSLDAARAIRRRVPRRTWVALYQQRPHEEEGGFFQKDWIQRFAPTAPESQGGPPRNVNTYLACDYGVREGGDTTELYRVDIDERGHWWVTDAWCGSENSAVWCGALVDLIAQHKPDAVAGEAGVIRRAVEPFLKLMMDESRLATVFLWAVRSSNKQASATGLQGIASMRRLHVAHGDWGDKLVHVLCAFPTSDDDHGVDALANLALCMEQTPGAFAVQEKQDDTRPDRWESIMRRARSGDSSGWKTA